MFSRLQMVRSPAETVDIPYKQGSGSCSVYAKKKYIIALHHPGFLKNQSGIDTHTRVRNLAHVRLWPVYNGTPESSKLAIYFLVLILGGY